MNRKGDSLKGTTSWMVQFGVIPGVIPSLPENQVTSRFGTLEPVSSESGDCYPHWKWSQGLRKDTCFSESWFDLLVPSRE